jgi:Xaa-Pro dipeptidase
VNRRRFVRLASLGTGLSLSPRLLAQRGRVDTPAADPLPPSLASLKSMRDRARPITNDERRARIERARRLMAAHHLDAMLLMGGTSLVYFSNIHWGLSERLFAMILPVRGEPFYVSPAFEEDRACEQIGAGPVGRSAEVRTWQEDESPYERIAQALKDRGLSGGRLGIEETVRFVFSDGVGQSVPALKIASATPVTAGCRMIKDAHEIELMQLASEVTLRAYTAAFRALTEGMTQDDVARFIALAHRQLGFAGSATVQTGVYSALPHGSITPQIIREGTIVLIDGGCSVEDYASDLSRTFVIGKASEKMRRVFDVVHRAQTAAVNAARPGLPLEAVDAAAREVIVGAGYGPGFTYFTHRVGHGIGMDGHEWPYLVRNNMFGWTESMKLEPGMVFSDEPGIYIRGGFGVRLEDDMHITESGAALFTPQSPSLERPFDPPDQQR